MPLAYFITFSTYGTWLHGTAKEEASVDRYHNVFGTSFVPANPSRESRAESRLSEPPYVLNAAARKIVRDSIIDLCRERNWMLIALHVRTNHLHAVISSEREPGRLMCDLKARASRALNRANVDAQEKRWTRHGSTRHLYDEVSVAGAVSYTLDEQGEPMELFDSRKDIR